MFDVKKFSDQELIDDDIRRMAWIDQLKKNDEELGGGDPLETFYERWNDVVDEMRERGLTVASDGKGY